MAICAEEYCREVLHPRLMQVRVLTGALLGLWTEPLALPSCGHTGSLLQVVHELIKRARGIGTPFSAITPLVSTCVGSISTELTLPTLSL
jgi:hypothetical protein